MNKQIWVGLGGDPEFFFKSKGTIFKGEKVVESKVALPDGDYTSESGATKLIRDGFQGEMNFAPSTCRQEISSRVRQAYRLADEIGYNIVLGGGYDIPANSFARLSEDSKMFGCVPSANVYGENPVGKDPQHYMFRPAGGHIHLSFDKDLVDVKRLVPVLDLLVGNISVAFDQDPTQVERRKTYGRAGEYRDKSYGVEYRTLGNFWLGHYTYLSLVYGLAREAVHIVHNDLDQELLSLVPSEDVVSAINNNDKNLATVNFERLRAFFTEHVGEIYPAEYYTISSRTFDSLLNRMKNGFDITKIGADYWKEHDVYNPGIEKILLYGN